MTLSNRAVSNLQSLMIDETLSDRYEVREIIGRGGMGIVYRAHDNALARDVAIKVIDEHKSSTATRERLQREASVLAGLEHPGIIPIHDVGVLGDGRAFYVMRLVRGKRLDEHVATGISRGDALRIVLRLSEAVAFANAQGVVHRDLKPGNVMIGPFGEVLVLDWGVAKVLADRTGATLNGEQLREQVEDDSSRTQDGAVVGTPGYMSPEQQTGNSARVDQTADVYSLGVMLRELASTTHDASQGALASKMLAAIVERATHPIPGARYTSAVEFADDVRHWMDGLPVSAYRERAFEKLLRLYRQHQTAVLLVATYLVVRTIILMWRNI